MTTLPGAVAGTYDIAFASERSLLRRPDGSYEELPLHRWRGEQVTEPDRLFDQAVVRRCRGATIDLGCGPGRLLSPIAAQNEIVLGVDRSPVAVSMARDRGANAIQRDIFESLPGEGRWMTALLIDGNVGIGGSPTRVVSRASELIADGGRILIEVDSAITHIEIDTVRIETPDHRPGQWFPWARVGICGLESVVHACGLTVLSVWEQSGRHVMEVGWP